jgi:hypothetical protein
LVERAGWVQTPIQTSRADGFLTINQLEIKANIKRVFFGWLDHLEGKERRASKIILKFSLKQTQRLPLRSPAVLESADARIKRHCDTIERHSQVTARIGFNDML